MHNTVTYPVFTSSDIFMNLPLFYETRGGGASLSKVPLVTYSRKAVSYHNIFFYFFCRFTNKKEIIILWEFRPHIRLETKQSGLVVELRPAQIFLSFRK